MNNEKMVRNNAGLEPVLRMNTGKIRTTVKIKIRFPYQIPRSVAREKLENKNSFGVKAYSAKMFGRSHLNSMTTGIQNEALASKPRPIPNARPQILRGATA